MGKALRDFTVEELDALPVGARFVDRGSWCDPDDAAGGEEYAEKWAYSKREDGRWTRQGLSSFFGMDTAVFLEDWRSDPYILEGDSSPSTVSPDAREALAPFVRFAEETPDDIGDDVILVNHHFVSLTVGDVRRAARFAKALNPA